MVLGPGDEPPVSLNAVDNIEVSTVTMSSFMRYYNTLGPGWV